MNLVNLLLYIARFSIQGKIIKIRKASKKRIFILGNGPSLSNDILSNSAKTELMKKEDVMVVNQGITNEKIFSLKPKYFSILDPLYWNNNPSNTKQYLSVKKKIQDINQTLNKINWPITILAPYHTFRRKATERITFHNKFVTTQTFNAIELHTFKSIEKFLYCNGYAIPSGINVLIASICWSLSLGYREVYLLGADHDWHTKLYVNSKNKLVIIDKHFYGEQHIELNHTLDVEMKNIATAMWAYKELAELGLPIYNLSSNSMIDAFPRKKLEDILGDNQ